MAFSNYIFHTLVCTTLFYGHGFGLFGKVERWQQFAIVLVIWSFQLIASPIWLARISISAHSNGSGAPSPIGSSNHSAGGQPRRLEGSL